ncbi:hypothetical protein VSX64_06160 [Aurantimonas sp. C2-6-R+9]|uniref:Uncharacterized protein n=1 Tax=Aurantimonas coralicida TaxID=182270 RepID=A0A9C9NJB0_9HYPH|nr:hypothetical protein [Aurantimonas sp. C2-6-R+9]HEU02857.1 hypothetical protein [Aurantimonas coralicida]
MMRFLLTLLLILPILLTPAYGMVQAPAIDISIPEASGATARAWSNAGKRCGMAAKGQQSSRCVVDLIAILSPAVLAAGSDRAFHKRTVDLQGRSRTPRPLTKPPRA